MLDIVIFSKDRACQLELPWGGPADSLETLVSAVTAAGLDGPNGPGMIALSVSPAEGDSALIRTAHPVLTDEDGGGALARLPHCRSASVAALRARAERVWQTRRPQAIRLDVGDMEIPQDMAFGFSGGSYHERNVVEWFKRLLAVSGSGAVYDIGANVGYFSVVAADVDTPVCSFEPVATTFDVLRRNRARHGISPEGAFGLALGARRGAATMHPYSSSGNNSLHARNLPPNHPLRSAGEELVDVATLDECVERFELTLPSVVKIDVEGAELESCAEPAARFCSAIQRYSSSTARAPAATPDMRERRFCESLLSWAPTSGGSRRTRAT